MKVIDLIERLKSFDPEMRVLMFDMSADTAFEFRGIEVMPFEDNAEFNWDVEGVEDGTDCAFIAVS